MKKEHEYSTITYKPYCAKHSLILSSKEAVKEHEKVCDDFKYRCNHCRKKISKEAYAEYGKRCKKCFTKWARSEKIKKWRSKYEALSIALFLGVSIFVFVYVLLLKG